MRRICSIKAFAVLVAAVFLCALANVQADAGYYKDQSSVKPYEKAHGYDKKAEEEKKYKPVYKPEEEKKFKPVEKPVYKPVYKADKEKKYKPEEKPVYKPDEEKKYKLKKPVHKPDEEKKYKPVVYKPTEEKKYKSEEKPVFKPVYKPKEEKKYKPIEEKKPVYKKPEEEKKYKPVEEKKPVDKPVYPAEKRVAVEGYVFCQDGYSKKALEGAVVSLTCSKTKAHMEGKTNSFGYFYFPLSFGGYKGIDVSTLKVKLVSSPSSRCDVMTNIKDGKSGASLDKHKTVGHKEIYVVGPFAFTPSAYHYKTPGY